MGDEQDGIGGLRERASEMRIQFIVYSTPAGVGFLEVLYPGLAATKALLSIKLAPAESPGGFPALPMSQTGLAASGSKRLR